MSCFLFRLRHHIDRLNLIAVVLHLFSQLADMEQVAAAPAEFQMILVDISASHIPYLAVIVSYPNLAAVWDLE